MNQPLPMFLLFVLAYVPVYANMPKTPVGKPLTEFKPADSPDKRLSDFRAFASKYFYRVKKEDTAFLKAHTIFPIRNSFFDALDWSLHGVNITAGIFFKRLRKLFPADLMSDIKKIGEYYVTPKGEEYSIECSHNTGGIDSNVTWVFLKRNGQFYFKTYLAEAG